MTLPGTVLSILPAIVVLITSAGTRADPDAGLQVETRPDGLAFQLDQTDTGGTGPWVLQQSRDGRQWVDIQFWEDGAGGAAPPDISIPWTIIAEPSARAGLFRAIRLESDDPFRRRFVAERSKWRRSGKRTYQYDLSQNSGRVLWRGIVNVTDNAVTSSTTIEFQPPFFEPPEIPTIEELFGRIADAIAADAHEITVTWDRDTGAPLTCFIDLDERIADEESGWSILSIGDQPDPTLQIEARADGLAFHLTGTAGTSPWVLQHSHDGLEWEDLQFWEPGTQGAEPPELEIPWAVLSTADASGSLFRAIQLAIDNPFRREFIIERAKWRLSGIDSYQYELRQSFGMVEWRGMIDVINGEVTFFTTIDVWPPGFEPAEVPTIDGLFERLANAIAADAHAITATWDQANGAPLTGYIDREEFLADEESGWSILSFTPAP